MRHLAPWPDRPPAREREPARVHAGPAWPCYCLSQDGEHKNYIPGKGIYSKKQHAINREATHVCQPIQTVSSIGDQREG